MKHELISFLIGFSVLSAVYWGIPWLLRKLKSSPETGDIAPKKIPLPVAPDPDPVLSAADRQLLQRSRESCLALKHVFPPRHPRRSLSFLGGQPMAPADFEWPMALNMKGLLEWLPFVGQIHCADIPEGEQTSILPREGVLYFFLPTGGNVTGENEKLAVQYVPGRPASTWQEHQGIILPPINGLENARYEFSWMNWLPEADRRYPKVYPRIEVELGWVSYGGEAPPENAGEVEGLPWEEKKQRYHANLIAFHGEPVEHDPLLSPHKKPHDSAWRVHDGFPLSWDAIGMVGGYLRVMIQEQKALFQQAQESGPESDITLPENPENLPALYDRLDARVTKLMSSGYRGLQEPEPAEKAEFWAFLDSLFTTDRLPLIAKGSRKRHLGFILNDWLSKAAIVSAEACLNDPEAAPRVPAEVVNALRQRHSVLKSHMFKDNGWHMQHQMLGQGDVVQEAADRMAETHLLLLQLSSDDALGIQMGDNGVYQFWITPADLAARHFDKTVVTFECH